MKIYRYFYSLLLLIISTTINAQEYVYDRGNRLTKVIYENGLTVSYEYDALGNRLSRTVSGVPLQTYQITTSVSPSEAGFVTGAGTYASQASVELRAIANEGYKFVRWSDGNTDNPRVITVTADLSLTALFEEIDESEEPDTDIASMKNVVYMNRQTATIGKEMSLSVNLKNNVSAEGFQFDLVLPDGVAVATNNDGTPIVSLSASRAPNDKINTFGAVFLNDGTLRVFAASTNGSSILDVDGQVAKVKVNVAGNVTAGTYPVILRNISIADSRARSFDVSSVKSSLIVSPDLLGDANGDGSVTFADAVAVVNYILGNPSVSFNIAKADVNGDTKVTITDAVGIVNIILNQ